MEGFILQIEVACLTTSFIKILTIALQEFVQCFLNNPRTIESSILEGTSRGRLPQPPEQRTLGRANCSGPCTGKDFVSPRMDISQLSEQLVQCLTMLIVNALFPNQVSFPYSKLCLLSHTLLQYISDLCFLYAFQSFKSTNIFPDPPTFKTGLNRPFIFWLYATSSNTLTILMSLC